MSRCGKENVSCLFFLVRDPDGFRACGQETMARTHGMIQSRLSALSDEWQSIHEFRFGIPARPDGIPIMSANPGTSLTIFTMDPGLSTAFSPPVALYFVDRNKCNKLECLPNAFPNEQPEEIKPEQIFIDGSWSSLNL
ncbi:hypothetical protein [Methanoregula sp.]|uniref:hypothetical protein n=1 Tax=Methanoregula sp. TaxID=2052170 RepID=UPI0035681FDC